MTPSAQMQSVLVLLGQIETVARPADAIVSGWFRTERSLTDADRAAILETLNGVLRQRARLGWWVQRHGRKETTRNRLLAWLMLNGAKTPDQVKRLFSGGTDAPAALSEAETALLIKLQGSPVDHPDMPQELRLECPPWAVGPLRHRFGPRFEAEMAASLTPPTLDLRVNTLKTTPQAMEAELHGLGFHAERLALAPAGLRLEERVSLSRLSPLRSGELEIQDEGSQLVAMLVEARPGDRVVDFCAGACGKTLALASQMNNKGHIIACDVNEARLKRGAERVRRAGVFNVQTRLLSSETDRWIKRHKGGFDRVLVDAPCSGTGTWRRNPDARWRAPEENGLEALLALQARILASAARLVRPGGRLVYATCSLLCEENEQQVDAFLAANPAFQLRPLQEVQPQLARQLTPDPDSPYLSLTPAQHGTDGFFAAVLQKELAPHPVSA